MAKINRKKDLFFEYLLREYYEQKLSNRSGFYIPFEFLYDDELEAIYNSIGFAFFRLRYQIYIHIKKIVEKLKL